jgi:hypothetical protein
MDDYVSVASGREDVATVRGRRASSREAFHPPYQSQMMSLFGR